MDNLSPQARSESLLVQQNESDYLIYDLNTNKALCLNEISSWVWKKCDGINSIDNLAKDLSVKLKTKIDEDFIWLVISDLEKNNLLANKINKPIEFDKISRRKVLFKYALPSLMIPLIVSVVAPVSTNAQSVMGSCSPSGNAINVTGVDCGVTPNNCGTACDAAANTQCCSMMARAICGSFCSCVCLGM